MEMEDEITRQKTGEAGRETEREGGRERESEKEISERKVPFHRTITKISL